MHVELLQDMANVLSYQISKRDYSVEELLRILKDEFANDSYYPTGPDPVSEYSAEVESAFGAANDGEMYNDYLQYLEKTMRIKESKLRQTIQKVILEFGPPGIGGGGNYGRGSDIERSAPSYQKGYGWMEFIAMAEDGDYDGAGAWLQELATDYGITIDREIEDSFIEMASADATAMECENAWNEYLQMMGM